MKPKLIITFLILFSCIFQGMASVTLIMPHRSENIGTQITIPVKVKDFQDILSIQGTLQFDQSILSFVSIQQYGLPGMNAGNFGTVLSGSGKLTFSWFDNTLLGIDAADSATIFSVTFNIIGTAGQVSTLGFVNSPVQLEIANSSYTPQTVLTSDGSITVSGVIATPDLRLYADTLSTTSGTQVGISIRAKDFININSLQGTLQFNPAVASYAGLSYFGLPGMNLSNFGTTQVSSGKLMFTWNDGTLAGQNMPDDAALFTILFNAMGSPGTQTSIDFVNNPTPLEITDSLSGILNAATTAGRIRIVNATTTQHLTYFCDTISAPQGSVVSVSMRAIDFTDIVSLQGTLQFNPSIATFDTIHFYGLPDMTAASFGLTQVAGGKLMFSWDDPTLNGVTLADSAVLFSMKFKLIGTPGTYSMLDFVNAPVLMETVNDSYLTVNDSLISGKLNIISDGTLVVNDPTVLAYCPGDALTTSYSASGIFVAGNQFILQLSDVSGNFFTCTNLDTLTSVTSGTFTCTLPLSLPAGNAYRLRVMSTNPELYSNPGIQNISILTPPSLPSLPTGITQLCLNPANSLYTSNAANASSMQWSLFPASAGAISGSSTTSTVDWNNGFTGNAWIKVKGSNGSCTGPWSDSLMVTISDYPAAATQPAGDTLMCQNPGTTAYSTAVIANADTYQWLLNPGTAGTISGSGNNITISWSAAFSGIAQLTVNGVHAGCSGASSPALNIHILTELAQASLPTGSSALCINNSNTIYTTTPVSGATGYIWTLTPAGAGTITPSGNTAEVDWNNGFTGPAHIVVAAINAVCQGASSDTLHVMLNDVPPQAAQPTGTVASCVGVSSSNCSTSGAAGATSYNWGLWPSAAGSVSGTTTNATLSWTPGWTGTAYVFVNAGNSCGTGINSDSLAITIHELADAATQPAGDTLMCQNPGITAYSTTVIANADSYQWQLNPGTAGTISGSGNTITISWSAAFSGIAQLTVNGIHAGCSGAISPALNIHILAELAQASLPTGSSSLCLNNANTTYTTTPVSGATGYIWTMTPAGAGTITPTGNTAEVDWNNGFTGPAHIVVAAINAVCQGASSDTLHVMLNDAPPQAAQPTGTMASCVGVSSSNCSTSDAAGATSYNWGLWPSAAGSVSGTTTNATLSWTPGWTGTAYVFVNAGNSCGTGINSDSLAITIHPLPATPVITTNFGTLNSSNATGNQWYANGVLLPGETGQDYTPVTNGNYYVVFTDANGCWSSSDTLNVYFVGLADLQQPEKITLSPNPSPGLFSIVAPEITRVEVSACNGALLYKNEEVRTDRLQIDFSGKAPGLYFVKVQTRGFVKVFQLIIE